MMDEVEISNIYEFSDDLEALLKRSDLDAWEAAAALVSAAVVLTARIGCDPYEQEMSIAGFAENAIVGLIRRNECGETRH
jgi:hypothetical protein